MTMERVHEFARGHCSFCENITSVGVVTKTGKGRVCMVCQRKISNFGGGQDKIRAQETEIGKLALAAQEMAACARVAHATIDNIGKHLGLAQHPIHEIEKAAIEAIQRDRGGEL